MYKLTLFLMGLAVMGFLTGCGSKGFAPVKGQVTLDGAPVAGAALMFFPDVGTSDGLPAGGRTDAEGYFTLTTSNDVGVRPGIYKVTAIKEERPAAAAGPGKKIGQGVGEDMMPAGPLVGKRPPVKHLLPVVYSDPTTTPLRVEVPSGGSNTVVIALQSK